MRLRLSEKPSEWRKFTWSSAAAATLFSVLLAWRGRVTSRVPLGVAAVAVVVGVLAAVRPGWFRGFYRAGRRFGHAVGRVVGTVLLAVLWLVVLVPLGIALRLAGKDPLRLRREPDATTHWRAARPPGGFDRLF